MPRHRRHRASSGGQRRTHSRTDRAELLFSVNHVERILRECHFLQRTSPCTLVFSAAVIQYLMAKVLDLVGNEAQKHGSGRITPEMWTGCSTATRCSAAFSERLPSHRCPRPGSSLPNTIWVPGPWQTGTRSTHSWHSPRLAGALGKVIDI
ncbi:Histone H2A-Bbd type 2/3 [Manis javanica]|nr:Histone H2A-Bbd type 2/3 [Manis javanica]